MNLNKPNKPPASFIQPIFRYIKAALLWSSIRYPNCGFAAKVGINCEVTCTDDYKSLKMYSIATISSKESPINPTLTFLSQDLGLSSLNYSIYDRMDKKQATRQDLGFDLTACVPMYIW